MPDIPRLRSGFRQRGLGRLANRLKLKLLARKTPLCSESGTNEIFPDRRVGSEYNARLSVDLDRAKEAHHAETHNGEGLVQQRSRVPGVEDGWQKHVCVRSAIRVEQ